MDPSNTQSGRERTLAALPTKHSDRSNYHRTLRRALKLAHEAVQFDSKNGYPEAAVNAYAQSVALLSEVIERVRNVKDSANTRKSFAPPEDEIKRLQAIVSPSQYPFCYTSQLWTNLAWYLYGPNQHSTHYLQHTCCAQSTPSDHLFEE